MYFIDDDHESIVHSVDSWSVHGLAVAFCGVSVLTETHLFYINCPIELTLCQGCMITA